VLSGGVDKGSVVTPPTLFLPADAIDSLLVTPEQFRMGAEVYRSYLEWSRERRQPPSEPGYTISDVPQLPPGKNVPVAIEAEEIDAF
jgi:hypothetical protein